MKYRILLVDDDSKNLDSTAKLLSRRGYEVEISTTGDDAISKLKNAVSEFAVVLLDYDMPEKDGPAVTREIREFNNEVVILIHSAYRTTDNVLSSFRAGSVDFIEKSENTDYLENALAAACAKFDETTRRLKPRFDNSEAERILRGYGIIGKSSVMVSVAELVDRFRVHKSNILVLGESGTGKELIARALHTGSPSQFFAINCAGFANSDLLGSELFGHEKGSFTGAHTRKIGVFEAARGGTVFLDELHCLNQGAQEQLLRAIRERKIRRVGANQETDVDFKLVAATKPDLEEKVERKEFSQDLFFRLNFLKIVVPPLRDRPEDIEPLILHFCEKYEKAMGQKKSFLMKTVRILEKYKWPGNVGELEACVFNLLARTDKETVGPELLDPKFTKAANTNTTKTLPELDDFYDRERRSRIISAISSSDGSIAGAATRLGVKRSTLHTLLTRMGMRQELEKLS